MWSHTGRGICLLGPHCSPEFLLDWKLELILDLFLFFNKRWCLGSFDFTNLIWLVFICVFYVSVLDFLAWCFMSVCSFSSFAYLCFYCMFCFWCFHTRICTHFHPHSINTNLTICYKLLQGNWVAPHFSLNTLFLKCKLPFLFPSMQYHIKYSWKHVLLRRPHLLSDFRILPCSGGSLVEQSQKEIQLFAQVWKASVSELQSVLLTRMNPLAMHPFCCKIVAVWNLRPLLQIHEWF